MYCKEIISPCPPCDRSGRAALLPERNTYAAANAVHSLGEGQWGGRMPYPEKSPFRAYRKGFFRFLSDPTALPPIWGKRGGGAQAPPSSAHPHHVPVRRFAKQPLILPVELRRALVADGQTRAGGILAFREHEALGSYKRSRLWNCNGLSVVTSLKWRWNVEVAMFTF